MRYIGRCSVHVHGVRIEQCFYCHGYSQFRPIPACTRSTGLSSQGATKAPNMLTIRNICSAMARALHVHRGRIEDYYWKHALASHEREIDVRTITLIETHQTLYIPW